MERRDIVFYVVQQMNGRIRNRVRIYVHSRVSIRDTNTTLHDVTTNVTRMHGRIHASTSGMGLSLPTQFMDALSVVISIPSSNSPTPATVANRPQ
jgi:hypothetical protein